MVNSSQSKIREDPCYSWSKKNEAHAMWTYACRLFLFCEAGSIFGKGAMQALPITVESIFTEASTREVITQLRGYFLSLHKEQP